MENPQIKPQIAPFKHLCMSIGAIPTSFQDSMDYYECVLWLIKYLENTIIPVVNNNGEAVAELQDLYITLKNYVENYFENLDVQDEINNKLDEMAEDGTLINLISEYLSLNSILQFNTVSDMKNATNLSANCIVKTLGFHTLGDKGGSYYLVSNTGTPNEMDVIALQNNLFANLIPTSEVNVKSYGAYGDGTHDDTSIIQYYVNNNSNLLFEDGSYKISDTISISNKDKNIIDLEKASIIYTGEYYAFNFNTIRNSIIKFNTITAQTGGCVLITGTSGSQYSQYNDFYFKTFTALTDCMHVENSGNCWISEFRVNNGRFSSGNNGFYILQNSSAGLSHWTFNNVGIEGVDVGFNFEIGEYAEANNHWIDSFEFNECRAGEADILIKNSGIIRKFLWVSSHYVTYNQLDVTSDASLLKFIHADRINYVYNGVWCEHGIEWTTQTYGTNVTKDGGRIFINDNICAINLSIKSTTGSDLALTNNQVIMTDLPKPINPIFILGHNYVLNPQIPVRFLLDTNGTLKAYYPGNAVLPGGGYCCIINASYFIKSME